MFDMDLTFSLSCFRDQKSRPIHNYLTRMISHCEYYQQKSMECVTRHLYHVGEKAISAWHIVFSCRIHHIEVSIWANSTRIGKYQCAADHGYNIEIMAKDSIIFLLCLVAINGNGNWPLINNSGQAIPFWNWFIYISFFSICNNIYMD